MSLPKNKLTENKKDNIQKSKPKSSPKDFQDLFEWKEKELIAKGEVVINGKTYQSGDVITETKFQKFDLLDNPEKYRYTVQGKILIGKLPKKIS